LPGSQSHPPDRVDRDRRRRARRRLVRNPYLPPRDGPPRGPRDRPVPRGRRGTRHAVPLGREPRYLDRADVVTDDRVDPADRTGPPDASARRPARVRTLDRHRGPRGRPVLPGPRSHYKGRVVNPDEWEERLQSSAPRHQPIMKSYRLSLLVLLVGLPARAADHP